jgi:hypothetical protein
MEKLCSASSKEREAPTPGAFLWGLIGRIPLAQLALRPKMLLITMGYGRETYD